jgi:hypothetical protein
MYAVPIDCAKACMLLLVGSLVTPESTKALAPANAAASAARWVSLRAVYKVTTSMANAAIANKLTIDTATSKMVWPRSPRRDREIISFFLSSNVNPYWERRRQSKFVL